MKQNIFVFGRKVTPTPKGFSSYLILHPHLWEERESIEPRLIDWKKKKKNTQQHCKRFEFK